MRLLTLARDLRRRKARERQRLFVAEGVRAVEELPRSSLVIRGVLAAPQLDETPEAPPSSPSWAPRDRRRGGGSPRIRQRGRNRVAAGHSGVAEVPDRSL